MVCQHSAKSSEAGSDASCSGISLDSERVVTSGTAALISFSVLASSLAGSNGESPFAKGLVPSTSRIDGICRMGGVPGFRKDWFEIFGSSEKASAAVAFSVVEAVPPSGLFTLLRLPRFFEKVIGVDLQEAKFHR